MPGSHTYHKEIAESISCTEEKTVLSSRGNEKLFIGESNVYLNSQYTGRKEMDKNSLVIS